LARTLVRHQRCHSLITQNEPVSVRARAHHAWLCGSFADINGAPPAQFCDRLQRVSLDQLTIQ
jgi:hypothetical protein